MRLKPNFIFNGVALAALLLGGFQNCGFKAADLGSLTNSSEQANYAQAAAFDEVFQEIIVPKCVSCHNATTGPFDLTSYTGATSRIDWIDLEYSPILTNVLTEVMPQTGTALTASEKELMSNWVLSGAPETLPGPNDPPVISHVDTVGSVQLGANGTREVSSSVVVVDAGYRVASYSWQAYSGPSITIHSANTNQVNIRFTQPGATVVRLTIRGTNGKSTTRDFTFNVTGTGLSTPTPTPRVSPSPGNSPTATPTPTPTATPAASQATYTWLKTNVFETKKCTVCHTTMKTYTGLTGTAAYIKAGDADGSGVYKRTANGTMPAGGAAAALTTQELAALKTWINNGAQNN